MRRHKALLQRGSEIEVWYIPAHMGTSKVEVASKI